MLVPWGTDLHVPSPYNAPKHLPQWTRHPKCIPMPKAGNLVFSSVLSSTTVKAVKEKRQTGQTRSVLPITHWTEMCSADAEQVPSSQSLVPPSETLRKVFPTVWQYLCGQQGETLEKKTVFSAEHFALFKPFPWLHPGLEGSICSIGKVKRNQVCGKRQEKRRTHEPKERQTSATRAERWRAFVRIEITCAIQLKAVALLSQRRV